MRCDTGGLGRLRLRLGALATGDVVALLVLRPRPRRLMQIATHPADALSRLGPDHVVALVAAAGLWLAAAWIALGLLAAAGARLPGLAGGVCSAVATVALPAAVRRVAIGALGVGLLAGPTTSAFATPTHAMSAVVASSYGRQSSHPGPGASWPTSTPATPTPPMTPHGSTHHVPDGVDGGVRVRAGDSLWLIAGHRLGDAATPHRIAAYWPQVYAANRSVVGPDPGQIMPGQVLHLPDPHSS